MLWSLNNIKSYMLEFFTRVDAHEFLILYIDIYIIKNLLVRMKIQCVKGAGIMTKLSFS